MNGFLGKLPFNPDEATMEIRLIACDKIEFPTANEELRTFHLEAAQELAQDIEERGMFHPIAVRPNPAKPDYYLGIHGRHRLYARAMILKHPLIECNVLEMSDEEAEAAAITENLFRLAFSQPQKTKAIKMLREIYVAKYPERVGKGKAGGAAMKRKAQVRKKAKSKLDFASGEKGEESPSAAPGGKDENARSFPAVLAAISGISESSAKREQRLAVNLTDWQLSLCDVLKLNKGQMESLATIKSEAERDQVLSYVRVGKKFDDAWREVDPGGEMARGKPRSRAAAVAAAKEDERPELSDDEWFEQNCGETAAKLANPASFKSDALIFRRAAEPRHLFRIALKMALKDHRKAKTIGPFQSAINVVTCISHPRNWTLCGGCGGSGEDRTGAGCTTCRGAGYLLKSPPEDLTTVARGNHEDRTASPGKGPATSPLNAVSPPGRVQASNGKPCRPVKPDPEPEAADSEADWAAMFDGPLE